MTEIVAARLGYGWGWSLGEDGWKTGVDENFRETDTLIGLTIIDDTLTAPPGSPADGDIYIPHATATGAWAGKEGKIATYQAGTWYFYPVVKGLRALFAATSTFKYYTGSVWAAEPQNNIWNAGSVGAISSDFTISGTTLALAATLDLTGHTAVRVPAPVSATDAVTKLYADTAIQGLSIKPTAVVATITTLPAYTYANGTLGVGATLTGSATGTLTIDGHLTALNDVILVKNETAGNAPNNGLYKVTTAGAGGVAYVLTREIDMDISSEFTGALVAIGEVSVTYPGTLWICNQTAPTVGTTSIGFTQISAVAANLWNAGTVTAIKATQLEIVSGTLDIKSGATLDATTLTGAVNVGGTLAAFPISNHFSLNAGTLALQSTLDLSTLTEVKVPTTTNAADAARKDYVDNAVVTGLSLQGYLSGLQNTTVSTTTFSVGAGQAMSDDNTTMMTLGTTITKSTAGTWVVGTGNNGLDTGVIANSTWYHVWLIYNPGGNITEVLLSLSATSPTMPTGYTKKRRVGSQKTGPSTAPLVTIIQNGDRFDWATPVNDVVSNTPGVTTGALVTLPSVPLGVIVQALLSGNIGDPSATSLLYLSSPAQADVLPSVSALTAQVQAGASNGWFAAIETDTSQQIRRRVSTTTVNFLIVTNGWIDKRGASSGGTAANWTATPVSAIGNGLVINSGTILSSGTIAYTGTNAGTVTIVPTSGISDIIVTGPAGGGGFTVDLGAVAFAYQDWRLHIKQGAVASTVTLTAKFKYAGSGGPTSYTATAVATQRDMLWCQSPDGTNALVGSILQAVTI